jgi:nucleoid DNA-binding protein
MNKKELVAKLSKKTGLSQVKTMEVVNALFSVEGEQGILVEEILGGNKVTVPGFGTFSQRSRAAREGRRPGTTEVIQIAATPVVHFKVGKNLRDMVRKGR